MIDYLGIYFIVIMKDTPYVLCDIIFISVIYFIVKTIKCKVLWSKFPKVQGRETWIKVQSSALYQLHGFGRIL